MAGIKLHPRTMPVQRAEADLKMHLISFQREHDLTDIELVTILLAITASVQKYVLRQQRHPDDPERKADEE